MKAILWNVSGQWWDRVERELEVSPPPPPGIVVPRLESLRVRDFVRGEELGKPISILETDTYSLWRVYKRYDEAHYVYYLPTSEGRRNER